MHVQAGERLRLTLWGAGFRAMVSLNAYGVIQPAVVGMNPAEGDFTYDVAAWLHDGCNILTVVLIGAPGDVPFRMRVARDGQADWTLDEADFLPLDTPWRRWKLPIELEAPRAGPGAYGQAAGRPPDPHERKPNQRTNLGQIPAHGLDRRFLDIRHSGPALGLIPRRGLPRRPAMKRPRFRVAEPLEQCPIKLNRLGF